jgi:hypothetical protein
MKVCLATRYRLWMWTLLPRTSMDVGPGWLRAIETETFALRSRRRIRWGNQALYGERPTSRQDVAASFSQASNGLVVHGLGACLRKFLARPITLHRRTPVSEASAA